MRRAEADASAFAVGAGSRRASPTASTARAELDNDRELLAAGILPGDPSLYPTSLDDLYGARRATADGCRRPTVRSAGPAERGRPCRPTASPPRFLRDSRAASSSARPIGARGALPGGPLRHVRPPDEVGDFGGGAVNLMGADRHLRHPVRVRPREPGQPALRPQGMPRSLATADFRPYVLRRGLSGQSGTQWFFTEAGRPFTLYVVLGSHARGAGSWSPGRTRLIGSAGRRVRRPPPSSDGLATTLGRSAVELIGPYLVACVPAGGGRRGQGRRGPATPPGPSAAVPVSRSGRAACWCGSGSVAARPPSGRGPGLPPGPWPAGLVAAVLRRLRRLRGLCAGPGAGPSPAAGASARPTPRPPGSTWSSTWHWPCRRLRWPWPAPSTGTLSVGAVAHQPWPRRTPGPGRAARRLAGLSGHLGAWPAAGGPAPDGITFDGRRYLGRVSTTLVERASASSSTRLSRRASSTGRPSSAARWPSDPGSIWSCSPGTAYGRSAPAGTATAVAGRPAAPGSPSSAARSTTATTTARPTR